MVHKISKAKKDVMKALYVGRNRWQTTHQVAEIAEVSWMTTRKHLEKLNNKNKVSKKRESGRTYWKI